MPCTVDQKPNPSAFYRTLSTDPGVTLMCGNILNQIRQMNKWVAFIEEDTSSKAMFFLSSFFKICRTVQNTHRQDLMTGILDRQR